jgi:hypothetical protein
VGVRLVGPDERALVEVAKVVEEQLEEAGYTVEVAAQYADQIILGVSGCGMEAGLSLTLNVTT